MKKKLIIIISVFFAIVFATVTVANVVVINAGNDIYDSCDGCGTADYILILGCGVKSDGSPSDMLKDRLARGCELYFLGAADKILLSGDNESDGYDEITPMTEYCLAAGVPEDALIADRLGVSTSQSISRAKTEYSIKSMIVVTQKYHLYRSLYLAGKSGIDAVGVSADLHEYRGQLFREIREIAARTKDFFIGMFF